MADVLIGIASIGTLLAGIGSLAAWRQSKASHAEVKTNHGKRAGEYLELIHADVRELRLMMVDHITDRASHN